MVNYNLPGKVSSSTIDPQDRIQMEIALSEAVQSLAELGADVELLKAQMDSCYLALDIISNYKGDDDQIIKLVNFQHAMERLLDVTESNITVAAAQEGLGEAIKSIWEKVKALFKRIWDWIKNFFSGASKKVEDDTSKSNELKDSIKEVESEELKKLLDEPMPGLLSKKCVDAMYKSSSYISGSNGPILSYVKNMTRILDHAEKYLNDIKSGKNTEDRFDISDDILAGLAYISTEAGASNLVPYGMKYTFSMPEGVQLTKIDEGFLEPCETMKAGGWTSASEYTERCAIICNVTSSAFEHLLGNKAQIQNDLDKCGKLADKAKDLVFSNGKFNLKTATLRETLVTLARGLQIIALRLKQVNSACYCAPLDARVQRLRNRNVQPQHKIDD